MNDNQCRIIKIERDALYEFIYESFIEKHRELLDLDAVGHMNTFAIDWESGTFIFCAHKDEDENGEIVPFPEDIAINELLHNIPSTTDSVFGQKKNYRDYSFDELKRISNSK